MKKSGIAAFAGMTESGASLLNHRRGLDLDLGGAFDEALHLDQRLRWIMGAHDLLPRAADLVAGVHIFVAVGDEAGHANDMLRPGAVLGEDCERVAERPRELAVERIF